MKSAGFRSQIVRLQSGIAHPSENILPVKLFVPFQRNGMRYQFKTVFGDGTVFFEIKSLFIVRDGFGNGFASVIAG